MIYRILVGAPEYKINNLPTGAIFKCPITNRQISSDCRRINVDDDFGNGGKDNLNISVLLKIIHLFALFCLIAAVKISVSPDLNSASLP